MLKLAAFADEISPDLDVQIRACKENDVSHIELRGVDNINVLDFNAAMCQRIKSTVAKAGMEILCIASPIGKVKITDDWGKHFERFRIAVEQATFFGAKFIRIFSYYPDDAGEILKYRDEVMKRMRQKLDYIKNMPVTLLHENEARIFGEKGEQCLDMMKTIASPKFRSAFDFSNFVQAKEKPRDCWVGLKQYSDHIHVKDATFADGKVVPAGRGDGDVEMILSDAWKSGYRGFLSLEPHLQAQGQFSGFSGPDLFRVAADALKDVCRRAKVPVAGT